jgi:hypothetical protein
MSRQVRQKAAKPSRMVAYDFETTRIRQGTPRPLYLTAYGLDPEFCVDTPIRDMTHLRELLEAQFLTDELQGTRYVAWNANAFDAYFVAAALLESPAWVIRPYLTKGNSLRGLRVLKAQDAGKEQATGWEFLDGMAMLGLAGTPLSKLLNTFAPEFRKLSGTIDFEREEFDPENPAHRAYAFRDSEGLWHAMTRAQAILLENFNQPLSVTMGAACIKIFKAHIPPRVDVRNLPDDLEDITRQYVVRGGFCYCARRYEGPVWKYDLNQAYAAAMREAQLPAGRALHTLNGIHRYAKTYIARVTATHPTNIVPFYYVTLNDRGQLKAAFATTHISETWITSVEVEQLKAEGWRIKVLESWTWETQFSMADYVNRLEGIRTTCEGGPSGPIGTVIKAVGNHSYGKTLEVLGDQEFIIAKECPADFAPYYADGFEPINHVFWKFTEPRGKDYHQPHLGGFITAYVRMVLRRAILLRPDDWLYADTDCVVFASDVTNMLDVDPKRYGAWKVEETGTHFRIIAKKVYQNVETGKGHAKGLNVKRLTPDDYEAWFHGTPPVQDQVQRNNFVSVMQGAEMYRLQTRAGTSVEKTLA